MLYFSFITQSAKTVAQKGAGMAEYALLLALIAVALIAGFQGLATAIGTTMSAVVTAL